MATTITSVDLSADMDMQAFSKSESAVPRLRGGVYLAEGNAAVFLYGDREQLARLHAVIGEMLDGKAE